MVVGWFPVKFSFLPYQSHCTVVLRPVVSCPIPSAPHPPLILSLYYDAMLMMVIGFDGFN